MKQSDLTKRLDEIVGIVGRYPEGATLIDVAVGLAVPATQRTLQRWLGLLVQQSRLVRVGGTHTVRYKSLEDLQRGYSPYVSELGGSILRLVNQPLAERAPADYRRIAMDGYQPNRTYYLPERVRAELGAPLGAATGAPVSPAWRDPAVFGGLATELAWRSGGLETQASDDGGKAIDLPDVRAWLAQPESLNPRPEVQLLWNLRAALLVMLNRAPNVALTYELLLALYVPLTKRLVRLPPVRAMNQPAPIPPLLRTEAVRLPGTVYCAPADPSVIATGFNQILGWSPAIADPVEQAFFVLVHLLYLQPFAAFNWSMACLAVNIPLLRAGLPPVTFGRIRLADLVDGVRGVWELNRTELLRDVFIAAYTDSRVQYGASAVSTATPTPSG